ncbi:substrate-binding domain-containing protein [Caldovatus aquaticus]|uniref:Substrate-binding domain-containing protein n=1 Tax=Caldovatus aquaticus TaxID=2865671 RepID=A0ABS7F738_9PROT|nr:substrate-binding domain-containing protein [Caldovatus aquaticus]MBW8270636.1 substrate-binding domain-containing protein [Caldovatus aquaticus]
MRRALPRRAALGLCLAGLAPPAGAQPRSVLLASTTSTEQSGLFRHLLPLFTRQTGIAVRVVALGTGQALDVARRGDADAVLVHDPEAEARFVAEGHGIGRRAVMRNDFVLVGPAADPARIAGMRDAAAALRRIAAARAPFVSRGDRSGTHGAELALWRAAGLDPAAAARDGRWYRALGQGMGPTLNAAAAQEAYVLSDRGTWLAFRNRGTLRLLVEGDPRLRNPYSVILVNPARHPHVRHADARALADWLVSPEGQRAIADYRIGGEPLFLPDALPEADGQPP